MFTVRSKKLYLILTLCLISYITTPYNTSAAPNYALEYQNSALMLDIINAQAAYNMGYTGEGIHLGVFDVTTKAAHPELLGKTTIIPPYLLDGTPFIPNWKDSFHGTHVAGIMAAHRDGIGMHGVAYDANLYGMTIFDEKDGVNYEIYVDYQEFFAQFPEVRIVNNSWGSTNYPYTPYTLANKSGTTILTATDVSNLDDYLYGSTPTIHPVVRGLAIFLLQNPDKVFVWAEGNDGMPTGSVEELIPRYMGSALSNWINAVALDSSQISRNADGSLTLAPAASAFYSNFAAGSERWTLSAPGTLIDSAHSADDGYIEHSGTSMASPVVAGALGLVQQRFPWMTGKQLADTVLSTANSNLILPDYTIQFQRYPEENLVFSYIEQAAPAGLSVAQLKQMLKEHYDANPESWHYMDISLEDLYGLIDKGRYAVIDYIRQESIFGQGILDIGKAMGGIAELDANRMTENNVLSISELGGTQDAIEILNTQGYDAELSNDITQFQWDDAYHHAEYQTTGTTGYNDAALALVGKNIGIMKTGLGRLILSGNNTYHGATIVENGELTIATRVDGTGGILQNSPAIVRTYGTLSGNGTIATQLINNGIVSPGLFGLASSSIAANTTLNVATYTQGSQGTLRIFFDNMGNYGKLNVTTANNLDGTLRISPVRGFYQNTKTQNMNILSGVNPTGQFASFTVENISPTLDFTITELDAMNYSITSTREEHAYSQYARNTTADNVGTALAHIATTAQGDMQELLTALDFSAPNGQDVSRALTQLGPESYDMLSQASLSQQRSFNRFLVQRMRTMYKGTSIFSQSNGQNTGQNSIGDVSGVNAGDSHNKTPYTAWGQVLGSSTYQGTYNDTSGYTSSGIGLLAGIDRSWKSGFTVGAHAALAFRHTNSLDAHDAQTETDTFSFGLQAHYAPENWEGLYLMAQGRLGFEQNTMDRTISFNNYTRTNDSQWTDFVGSALAGGGKDWYANNFTFGPLLWLEYSFMQRPPISESNGQATRLEMENTYYDSLRASLGAHVAYTSQITDKLTFDMDLTALWQHELLESSMSTKASFADYSNNSFSSDTALLGRNTFALQTSLRIAHIENYFAQLDVGAELTDNHGQALHLGLKFGYSF